MEFVGYVVKIGKCYFQQKRNFDYTICESFFERSFSYVQIKTNHSSYP